MYHYFIWNYNPTHENWSVVHVIYELTFFDGVKIILFGVYNKQSCRKSIISP